MMMMMLRRWLRRWLRWSLVAWLFLLANALLQESASSTSSVSEDSLEAYKDLVAWVEKEEGGYVDPRLGIVVRQGLQGIGPIIGTNEDKSNNSTAKEEEELSELNKDGTTTRTTIPTDTMILRIPGSVILDSDDDCEMVQYLENEIRLGSNSSIYPFLRMLVPQLHEQRLPSFWSESARNELQGLPPSEDAFRHVGWYENVCRRRRQPQQEQEHEGERNKKKMMIDNPAEQWSRATIQGLLIVVAYASSVGLPPIYHLMNHHRGLINTRIVITTKALEVYTSRPVGIEEQLFMDYVRPDTADLFRDYGFVESWPRKWSWTDPSFTSWSLWNNVALKLYWTRGGSGENALGILQQLVALAGRGASGGRTTHTFEIWPNGVVAIEPPATPEGQHIHLGSQPILSLAQAQEKARQHTQSLQGTQLQTFVQAALLLLNTTLPTTVAQDEDLLLLQQQQQGQDQQMLNLDHVLAIEYRLEFKRDVETAIQVATKVLEDRQATQTNQEL